MKLVSLMVCNPLHNPILLRAVPWYLAPRGRGETTHCHSNSSFALEPLTGPKLLEMLDWGKQMEE